MISLFSSLLSHAATMEGVSVALSYSTPQQRPLCIPKSVNSAILTPALRTVLGFSRAAPLTFSSYFCCYRSSQLSPVQFSSFSSSNGRFFSSFFCSFRDISVLLVLKFEDVYFFVLIWFSIVVAMHKEKYIINIWSQAIHVWVWRRWFYLIDYTTCPSVDGKVLLIECNRLRMGWGGGGCWGLMKMLLHHARIESLRLHLDGRICGGISNPQ